MTQRAFEEWEGDTRCLGGETLQELVIARGSFQKSPQQRPRDLCHRGRQEEGARRVSGSRQDALRRARCGLMLCSCNPG